MSMGEFVEVVFEIYQIPVLQMKLFLISCI